MSFQPIKQVAPFYVERGSSRESSQEGVWQKQGNWFRIGLVPPDDNDPSDPGTGTVPTANALWFALREVDIGASKAIYIHFRASFVGEYDTRGLYEWRIARVAMKTVQNALEGTAVRDVRIGSGDWFDDFMRTVTDMPVGQRDPSTNMPAVLTVRIKEVP